jgi:hypothetical protein
LAAAPLARAASTIATAMTAAIPEIVVVATVERVE